MPSPRQIKGTKFEIEVAAALEARRFRILHRNLRIPVVPLERASRAWVEVDLICEDERTGKLWIIEAKNHRNAASSWRPLVSQAQHRRLLRALSALRARARGRQVSWALVWRNPGGGVEFTENPCYF